MPSSQTGRFSLSLPGGRCRFARRLRRRSRPSPKVPKRRRRRRPRGRTVLLRGKGTRRGLQDEEGGYNHGIHGARARMRGLDG